jgi:transposase
MRTVGIDLGHKLRHTAVMVDAEGKQVGKSFVVETEATSLDRLITRAGTGCQVVIEPTGLAWVPVGAYLIHRGCAIYRVDTRRSSELRKVLRRDVKSDAVDALAQARMLRVNPAAARRLPMPEAGRFTLERLVRQRSQFVEDLARTKRRILAALEAWLPGADAVLGEEWDDSRPKRLLLRRFADPRKTLALGSDHLRQELEDALGREVRPESLPERWVHLAERAWGLYGPLIEAGTCPIDFDAAQREIAAYLDYLDDLERHCDAVMKRIHELYRRLDPEQRLRSLPGVGPLTAAYAFAVAGDVRRFPNAKAFVSFCGLAPRKNQSGQTDRGGQHISKAGNPLLRRYLFLAADVGRRGDLDLAAFYRKLLDRGTHHKAAVVAVAAKIARRLYAVMKRARLNAGEAEYRYVDDAGKSVSKKEAVRLTRQRFPSSAAAAGNKRTEAALRLARGSPKTPQKAVTEPRSADQPTTEAASNAIPLDFT